DPRDTTLYLVGGPPLIIVEEGVTTPNPTSTPAPTTSTPTPTTPTTASVDARIEIVWPQGNAPVTQADKANVSAYLFQSGGKVPVACDFAPTVRLWAAVNNDPARAVALGTRRIEPNNGKNAVAYDFNDVDVSAAKNPRNKLYLFVTVEGTNARSSIWSHGADARTFFPALDQP